MKGQDRAAGAFLGLAVGDALGTTLEFEQRGTFALIRDIVGGGPFDLPAGYWTDDTSMALCLADSLLENGGYDSYDVMDRYRAWRDHGYRSSTGVCFDIGGQTSRSIDDFLTGDGTVPADTPRSTSAGNGAIMRLAPAVIAAFGSRSPVEIIRLASVSARETHYSYEAEAGTEVFAAMLVRALRGDTKDDITDVERWSTGEHYDAVVAALELPLLPAMDAGDLDSSGYIIASLCAAVWAFLTTNTFEDGALAVVNLGGDADTNGAIYGQLAGAHYGLDGIPRSWREKTLLHDEIIGLAEKLFAMPAAPILATRFDEDTTR